MRTLLLALTLPAALAACMPASDDAAGDDVASTAAELEGADLAAAFVPREREIFVAIRDRRRCAPPDCGGWWVRRVDLGISQYVANLDLAPTGLPEATRNKVYAMIDAMPSFTRNRVALRGVFVERSDGLRDMHGFGAWIGPVIPVGENHYGDWYAFEDNHPAFIARKVHTGVERALTVHPLPGPGADLTETMAIGSSDGDVLYVEYSLARVR